jgi:hypothetical protein
LLSGSDGATLNAHRKMIQGDTPNEVFDSKLEWVIFGQGGSWLYQFNALFIPHVAGVHESPENALYKVCISLSLVRFRNMIHPFSAMPAEDQGYFNVRWHNLFCS